MNIQNKINQIFPITLRFFLVICLFVNPSTISAQTEEQKPLRQYDFIMHLVEAMQIKSLLPENPTINDYIRLLESKGITIPGGYRPDEYITTKQMGIMLVPAMGLEKARFEQIKSGIQDSYRDKATIIDIKGDAKYKLRETDEWKDAKPGVVLTEEDTVRTGVGAKLILRVGEMSIVTIKEDTVLTLYNLSKEPTLYIEKGEIILDTHDAEKKTPYHIVTPTTVTGVRGTIIRKIVRHGITREVCYRGKLLEYGFYPQYTYQEMIDMILAGTLSQILASGWIEVPSGYYYQEGNIFQSQSEELESIRDEALGSNITAEQDLLGETAIVELVEEGIWTEEDRGSSPGDIDEGIDSYVTGPPTEAEAPGEVTNSTTDEYSSSSGTGTVERPIPIDPTERPEGIAEPRPPAEAAAATISHVVNPSSSSTAITVDGTTYTVEGGVDDGGRNGSNEEPWRTIAYALSRVPGGSTIYLARNVDSTTETFPVTISMSNVTIHGLNNTIDAGADAANQRRVFTINVSLTGIEFKNLTIRGGYTAQGGGVYIDGSSVTFTDCEISNNTATDDGNSIYATNSATANFNRCKIQNNSSPGVTGCAITIESSTGNLTNCLVAGNTGLNFNSYGVKASGNSTVNITNCTIANNDNGVRYLDTSTGTVRNCLFFNNTIYAFYDGIANDPPVLTCYFFPNGVGLNNLYRYGLNDFFLTEKINAPNIPANSNNRASPEASDPSLKADYRLSAGSPTGVNGVVNNPNVSGAPSVDIRGESRDAAPDIGCYEYIAALGDPPITGRVYNSVTGETISSPTVAIYRSGEITALSTTTSNPYTFNVAPGSYYIAVSKSGYGFPSEVVARATSGDHGDVFTASDAPLTVDIPIDPDGWLVIEKTVNKERVTVGEIVTYNIEVKNKHWFKSIENVELIDEVVNGFKYVKDSAYQDSKKHEDPTISSRKAVFSLGTIPANTTINLSYQVRVGSAIPPGRYKAEAYARKSTTQERNSNKSSVSVEVVEDPIFTKGTIIGKVFMDSDFSGQQDSGENGIGGVRIATEYGVVIETDDDGKYHIADVPAGNHLLKVDPSTLPKGAVFTTDNPYFVKITEGLLAKVNFGITQINADQTQIGADKNKFFIVALGEGVVRNLDTSGNIDMADKDDRYDDGVRVDGRLAFYLKGKVLGKYLVTASVDTERRPYGRYDTRDLFTNLDPDKYYPVYGDASKVDYSGVNTQDVVYVLIEWDESFARWGSFHTDFPLYKRTLSGGIINYESVGKTRFGDPWTIVKGFGAYSRQLAAHDEFVGTGGSLYYLRHDNVVEGSEKVIVEVRDRIGKVVINTIALAEEKDYEIDYDSGRLMLRRPLNSIQQQYNSSIISNDILMGERVYLIVDYEHISDHMSNQAWGVKASQQIGHHVRVGGQYVNEDKTGDPYQLAGGDATIRINNDTRIDASYTHTEETQLGSGISYDGGLTFNDQSDTYSDGKSGSAVNVSGKTRLFKNTDVYLSYGRQDPFYSVTDSISTQGSQKYVAQIKSHLTSNLTVGLEHITQRLFENTIYETTIGAADTHTTTGMLDYVKNKWDFRAEYQYQDVKNPIQTFTYLGTLPLLNNNFVAGRVGYQLFDWLHPYVRGQATVKGKVNNQGTVGADVKIWKDTSVNLAETVGTLGNSTAIGVTTKITEGTDVYANLETGNHMMLGKYTKSTYGQSSQLGPKSRAYVEEDYSSYKENLIRGNLLGYENKITDTLALGLTYERSDIENNIQVINRDAGSVKIAYLNPDWLNVGSKLEVRNDRGTTEVRQWFTENDVLWRVTESISLSGRGNWGWTEDLDLDTDEAEFYELGSGFSFRPVTWDKLNILGKYVYLSNLPPDSRLVFIDTTESRRHVYAIEGAYDLFKYLQLVGKFAYRDMEEKVGIRDWTQSDTYLYIARTNFHIMNSATEKPFILRGWDFAVEYRVLTNDQIEDKKTGWLVELDKDLGNYIRMGVGYNFTDYDDDLRNEDNWDAKGWFVRVNGKY